MKKNSQVFAYLDPKTGILKRFSKNRGLCFSSGQTTYYQVPNAAFQGMLADGGPRDIISAAYQDPTNASPAVNAPFGVAMCWGTDVQTSPNNALTMGAGAYLTGQVCLPQAAAASAKGNFAGIATHQFIAPGTPGSNLFTGEQGIEPGFTVQLVRKGRIWVIVDSTTAVVGQQQGPVYFRWLANGANTQLGAFSQTSDGGHNTSLGGDNVAQFLTSAAGGGLALLEINF